MDLLKKNGCKFKARIIDSWCEGVIYVENNDTVYLMQNELNSSNRPYPFPYELGFFYSWHVDEGTEQNLKDNAVEDFEIIEDLSKGDLEFINNTNAIN